MESLQTRSLDVALRFDSETRQLSGIAVPYGEVAPSYRERFAKGSVTLDPNALLMWQHDRTEPIGKITSGADSDKGFTFEAFISDTMRGRDAATLAADGVLRLSVGFIMRDSVQVDGITEVRDALVKEISLVSFPAYEGATVTQVRDNTESEIPTSALEMEETVEEITPVASDLAEVREAIQHLEREVAGINKVAGPVVDTRTAGQFLADLAAGDELTVRAYAGATSGDSVTTPVDRDLIRIVEGANPLGAVFSRGVTPDTGMQIVFAKTSSVVDNTGEQSGEGEPLGYLQLNLTTDAEDIVTLGNFAELSMQAVTRSTVDYLDSVLRQQAVGLGNALRTALTTKYTATVAANSAIAVEYASDDFGGWAGAILDAKAARFQPLGLDIDALIVDTATAKKFLGWEGNPIVEFAGESSRTVGSFAMSSLIGSIAGVPVVVAADLNVDGSEVALVSSLALRQYTSAALRLSQDDAKGLSTAFSLSTYSATVAEIPAAVIPVIAAA